MTRLSPLPLVALLAAAPCAHGFTVEVGEVTTLLDVEVTGTALDTAVLLKIINRDAGPADCELVIDTGPEELKRRAIVPPGDSKVITQRVRPSTQRVRVSGTCGPPA